MNKRPTHEELLEGRVPTLSLLNEPIDFEVDYIVQPERPKLRLVVNNV